MDACIIFWWIEVSIIILRLRCRALFFPLKQLLLHFVLGCLLGLGTAKTDVPVRACRPQFYSAPEFDWRLLGKLGFDEVAPVLHQGLDQRLNTHRACRIFTEHTNGADVPGCQRQPRRFQAMLHWVRAFDANDDVLVYSHPCRCSMHGSVAKYTGRCKMQGHQYIGQCSKASQKPAHRPACAAQHRSCQQPAVTPWPRWPRAALCVEQPF